MTNIVPQRTVVFYGDELIGVQASDGTIYAPFSRLCDNLGLGRVGQIQRVQRHVVLRDALVLLTIQTASGMQDVQCLRVDVLPLWLAGIQASRVKEDQRDKLIRYQKEAAHVLWQAFKPQIIDETTRDDLTVSTEAEYNELARIADLGRAITRMAEEQLEQRRRLDSAARIVKGLQGDVANIYIRLGVLEEQASPAALITDAQAAEVSAKVKAVAEVLTTAHPGKRNQYQGIFAELYRRFNVTSYKLLRREQFDPVLAFLDDWQKAGEAAAPC